MSFIVSVHRGHGHSPTLYILLKCVMRDEIVKQYQLTRVIWRERVALVGSWGQALTD